MVEKLQHISLDTGVAAGTVDSENAPGMVDGWDYVNPRAPLDNVDLLVPCFCLSAALQIANDELMLERRGNDDDHGPGGGD